MLGFKKNSAPWRWLKLAQDAVKIVIMQRECLGDSHEMQKNVAACECGMIYGVSRNLSKRTEENCKKKDYSKF
jgi:hypothetical protein